MKNWLPLVSGVPLFAIASDAGRVRLRLAGGQVLDAELVAGAAGAGGRGSPHCSTNRPLLVIRWQVVPSKYFLPARNAKLFEVQGAFATSSVTSMSPWLVLIAATRVPVCGTFLVGGVPTSLTCPPADFV